MVDVNVRLCPNAPEDERAAALRKASEKQVQLQANGAAILLIISTALLCGAWLLGASKESMWVATCVMSALFTAGVLGLSPRDYAR